MQELLADQYTPIIKSCCFGQQLISVVTDPYVFRYVL
jgi:hypothetical protein